MFPCYIYTYAHTAGHARGPGRRARMRTAHVRVPVPGTGTGSGVQYLVRTSGPRTGTAVRGTYVRACVHHVMCCYGKIMAAANLSPTKFALADWHTSNFLVSSSAERQRAATHTIRQENHRLSNDTGTLFQLKDAIFICMCSACKYNSTRRRFVQAPLPPPPILA